MNYFEDVTYRRLHCGSLPDLDAVSRGYLWNPASGCLIFGVFADWPHGGSFPVDLASARFGKLRGWMIPKLISGLDDDLVWDLIEELDGAGAHAGSWLETMARDNEPDIAGKPAVDEFIDRYARRGWFFLTYPGFTPMTECGMEGGGHE